MTAMPPSPVRVFAARRVLTMNGSLPVCTHVRRPRRPRAGPWAARTTWPPSGPAERDDRFFRDKVLLPGFVEGHSHAFEGMVWEHAYLGFFDRRGPDGRVWSGLRGIPAVVDRLREAEASLPDEDVALCGWGFDPIYFDGPRMSAADLDAAFPERPVAITHASGHVMNVNTAALARAGFSRETELDGLALGPDGQPTGELFGPEAMNRVRRAVTGAAAMRALDADGLRRFARIAQAAGVTTATDLLNPLEPDTVALYRRVTAEPDYPLRVVPALEARAYALEAGVERWRALGREGTDKARFGLVKLVVDGSIQGFTARLRWPGYHDGSPNGMWYVAPAELDGIVLAYHRAGAQLHIHTNGDQATEAAVESIARALAAHPRADHRHTLQHCQMVDAALLRRMAALGICCNLFANHLWYWGDAHAERTMGPSRALRLDPCGSALAAGVVFGIHSDAPITPIGPLFTAWCAVKPREPPPGASWARRSASPSAPRCAPSPWAPPTPCGSTTSRAASTWASGRTWPCWTRTRSKRTRRA
jgi:predicted amidohydrolase YtcJ